MNIFDDMRNAWEPLYDPCSSVKDAVAIQSFPEGMSFSDEDGETLTYHGTRYPLITIEEGIREDGPDAWGVGFTIRKGTLFQWDYNRCKWYMATNDQYITIATAGNTLDTIELQDDGSVKWLRRLFVEI